MLPILAPLLAGCAAELPKVDAPAAERIFATDALTPDAAAASIDAGAAVVALVGLGDLDGDGAAELAVLRADDALVFRGADLAGAFTAADAWLTLDAVTGIHPGGDLDGDGLADLVAGAATAWGVFRGRDLAGGTVTVADAWARFTASGDHAVRVLAGGGDADGDGVHDLVGSEFVPDDPSPHEEVRVYSGAGLSSGDHAITDGIDAYGSIVDDDGSTASAALFGDVDGDGRLDLATGGVRAFASVHLGASLGGSAFLSDQEVHVHTCEPGTCTRGVGVGGAGDIDGDGVDDLVLSAFPDGTSWVIPGFALGEDVYQTQLVGGILAESRAITGAGALVGLGDLDGNGFVEVLAAVGDEAALLLGNQVANQDTVDVSDAIHTLVGFAPGGTLLVGAPGDLDGDGAPDLAVADAAGTVHVVRTPTAE